MACTAGGQPSQWQHPRLVVRPGALPFVDEPQPHPQRAERDSAAAAAELLALQDKGRVLAALLQLESHMFSDGMGVLLLIC